jgi:hypothetical protein
MNNYKSAHYDPVTLEKSEIETNIPNELVTDLKVLLEQMENYISTPTMINKESNSVAWGLINKEDKSLKYTISIKKIENE